MVGTVCVMCVMRKFGHPVCPCLRFWSTCCCFAGEFFFRAAISPIVNTCEFSSPFAYNMTCTCTGLGRL